MTNRNTVYGGAAMLIVGLFMPIMTMPIVGSINLFSNGSNEIAVMLVVLASASAILAANDRAGDVVYPAIASSALLVYVFGRTEYALSSMRESLTQGLKDNPFAGLAQTAAGSIQLQWGWLVLATGAGVLVYAAFRTRREQEGFRFLPSDATGRVIAALSLVLLLVAPSSDVIAIASGKSASGTNSAAGTAVSSSNTPPETAAGPGKEETAYIKDNLTIYDLSAKYRDSILNGRVPGVEFKIKNNGNRTLSEVDVRVVFYDKYNKPIAEETYYPVLDTSIDDNKPLRPNYIWQQEIGKFYSADKVPSEWKAGQVTATISDIKFAPNA